MIFVSHNFDQSFRLVAFDKQGTLQLSATRGAVRARDFNQTQGTFAGLKHNEIDRFEFQTRDYEFTEVANLPLRPPPDSGERREGR